MKEVTMEDWQITQVFLSETGVHEVYINLNNQKLRCNCDGYGIRSICKHTRFVKMRMDKNKGIYPVEVSDKVSHTESAMASLDPKIFRDFLIKYGRIEVV